MSEKEHDYIDIMLVNNSKKSFMRGYIPREEIDCIMHAGGIPYIGRPINMLVPGAIKGQIIEFSEVYAIVAWPKKVA